MSFKNIFLALLAPAFLSITAQAQTQDSITEFKPHGTLWGLSFGDYVYKVNADTAGGTTPPGRGKNQYSQVPAGSHYFQFRRIYLGYNYDFSPRLSAEVLLAAENDYTQGSIGNQSSPGDMLADNKFAPFIKLADVRWKNMFKGTDLVCGEMSTPAFPMLSEYVWGYRSVERTEADMRGTPSYDEGISLQGHYGSKNTFGYNLMAGNGNGAVPATNDFSFYYGDIWARLLNQHLIIDLYQDYRKLVWHPIDTSVTGGYHSDRNTTKLLLAYTTRKVTVGIEAMQTTLMGDVVASTITSRTFYYTTFATTISAYVRGRIYKDKLGFLARYDNYDPGHKINEAYDNPRVIQFTATSASNYNPATREQLLILGIDYTPFPNFHLMPNFYVNTYKSTLPSKYYDLNPGGTGVVGTDAVARLTVYFIFGKSDNIKY